MSAFRHHDGAVWLRLGDADGPDQATRVIDVWRAAVAKLLAGWAEDHYTPDERAVLDHLADATGCDCWRQDTGGGS